ncbi:MAG: hypothetical protein IKB39_02770 [Bacteroidaceae bacterium]|nr:hypothetical protein [Bacteroidaceae bacterium]
MMKGILVILMLVGALLEVTAAAPASFQHKTERTQRQDSTIRVPQKERDRVVSRKMSHSAYPVQMSVVGNAVRVESPESQILPIYTHTGTFYLIVRLNKGTNWLNGLPKGRYFINNRLIAIK